MKNYSWKLEKESEILVNLLGVLNCAKVTKKLFEMTLHAKMAMPDSQRYH